MLNLKSVYLFLILFLLSITDANAAVAFTRFYTTSGNSEQVFSFVFSEFLIILFVVMVSIVGAIENRIKNKNISKPKKPKKISKTDVPLIKSIQEFKKLKKNN
ncbi:hypothetical protein, partial [Gilliamella apis]